jgi:hypothetical protein
MKISNILLYIWFLLLFIISGCCANQKENIITNTPVINTPNETADVFFTDVAPGNIGAYYVSIQESSITIKGFAGVPDGTILHSQLYEEDNILEWWPADTDILVSGNNWMISVPKESGWFNVETDYILDIWQGNDPTLRGKYMIEFNPPPNTNGPFWLEWLCSVWNSFIEFCHERF